MARMHENARSEEIKTRMHGECRDDRTHDERASREHNAKRDEDAVVDTTTTSGHLDTTKPCTRPHDRSVVSFASGKRRQCAQRAGQWQAWREKPKPSKPTDH